LKSEKSKINKFTIYIISILMIGRTMASIKYDSKKPELFLAVMFYTSFDDDDNNSVIIYVPGQQLHGQLQRKHSVDTNNYITEKEKHKQNSHKASSGNSAAEKLLFLTYTTKESVRATRTRVTIPSPNNVVLRKPIKLILDMEVT
jgi:hypothetical protein